MIGGWQLDEGRVLSSEAKEIVKKQVSVPLAA